MSTSKAPALAAKAVSYEDAAGPISRFFMTYLDPLFKLGHSKPDGLVHEDLGVCSVQDQSLPLHLKFSTEWDKEQKKPRKRQSLWGVLWRTVGYDRICKALLLYATFSAISFGPILILTQLVSHFEGKITLSTTSLWTLVAFMFILPCAATFFCAQSNVILAHIGIQFRNVLIDMIYRKSLKLSPSTKQTTSTGQIVNMFSNDTGQLQRFLFFCNNVALAPFQIAVAIALIYQQVGSSVFIGLALMVVLTPVNAFIFTVLTRYRLKKVGVTDQRVKVSCPFESPLPPPPTCIGAVVLSLVLSPSLILSICLRMSISFLVMPHPHCHPFASQLMNEVLAGIRIIKSYAWETPFLAKITAIRNRELEILKISAYIVAVGFTLVLMAVPAIQPVLVFYTFVRLGGTLDASTAFTTIALFNLLQFPFAFLPMGLAQYSQSLVSCNRMLDFFASVELVPYVTGGPNPHGGDVVVSMDGASLCWVDEASVAALPPKAGAPAANPAASSASSSTAAAKGPGPKGEYALVAEEADGGDGAPVQQNRSYNTLIDVSCVIKRGQLVAVVGPVGSGKSSFLSALLGEMNLQNGSVRLSGSVAYCDQRPWILNATLRDNILFGLPYDEKKFDAAVHTSNLEDDIRVLPGGVLTEIGEKGINLSGGQKARVALARAVYREADLVLLDDPLSAVDAHVSQHLFEECVVKKLAGSTRILVTHHMHLLPRCDHIIILEDGRVKAQGTYAELQSCGVDITKIVPSTSADNLALMVDAAVAASHAEEESKEEKQPQGGEQALAETGGRSRAVSSSSATASQKKTDEQAAKADVRHKDTRSSNLTSAEERNLGNVAFNVYTQYIAAGGASFFLAGLAFQIFSQVFQNLSSFWLAAWGAQAISDERGGMKMTTETSVWYLNFYAMLAMLTLSCVFIRAIIMAQHRLGTSSTLHANLLKAVAGAPVSFFDITPLGRILNRFSSDMQTIDEELTQTIGQATNSLFQTLGALGAVAGATNGTFLILVLPLIAVYSRIQAYFRATNTTVARLEAVSRSPMYADFSQALQGTNSIRAYGEGARFITNLEAILDRNSIAGITQQLAGQWLAIRLDVLGAFISFFVAIMAVATTGFIPAGFLALGLSYSFQITTYLKFCVRILATGEAQMNSVERVLFYAQNIEQEKSVVPRGSDDKSPGDAAVVVAAEAPRPANWPSEGSISFQSVSMRYRDGPLVLQDVSIDVRGGEKIGVCGRTGSGKSSLMVALFRIQELAGGQVLIDGHDCSQVPLQELREAIGLIPQEAVLFSASVRFNLDPFNQHTDAEVWSSLEDVEMKAHVESLPGKLDELVTEGGDNFSAGQRQLICMSRALLRNPKILVLDEVGGYSCIRNFFAALLLNAAPNPPPTLHCRPPLVLTTTPTA